MNGWCAIAMDCLVNRAGAGQREFNSNQMLGGVSGSIAFGRKAVMYRTTKASSVFQARILLCWSTIPDQSRAKAVRPGAASG